MFKFFVISCGVWLTLIPKTCTTGCIDGNTSSLDAVPANDSTMVLWGDFKKGDNLHYYSISGMLNDYNVNKTIQRDSVYFFKEKIAAVREITLNYDRNPVSYILFPNDTVKIEVHPDNSYRLSAENPIRRNELDLQFNVATGLTLNTGYAYQDEAKLTANYASIISELNRQKEDGKISERFFKHYSLYVMSRYFNQLIFPLVRGDTPSYEIDIDGLKDSIPMDMDLLSTFTNTTLLINLARAKTSQQGLPVDQSNTLNTIEELYEGEVKDYVIARLIKEFLTIKNQLDPRSKESTLNRVTTPRFRDSILRYYHLEKEIAKDFSQAEITAMNGTISQFSRVLENTADTLIYVDYWASWCRPCIQEFSFSRQLKKKMNGKKIKFVYLSIDAQQNDWLAMTKKFDFMKEDNSFLIKNQKLSPLTRLLSVDAIPRYVLIKEDNIIHPKALRPSDPNIENFLEQYISQ